MDTVVLDINDATLGIWRGGENSLRSPGYALLHGDGYQFGEAARAKARLYPRQINHRFWFQLDMEPLLPAFGPSRHSADLVHAHLLEIHERAGRPEEVVIAAPGSLQHEQLALLLGIVEQCPFRAVGLVDRGVAAAASAPVADYNWHIELQLHQALVTGIRFDGSALQRDRTTPVTGSGWLSLQDALARAVADAFIEQTRFDPRRQAASEQSLYDRLPSLLAALESAPEHDMELEGRRARLERGLLAQACDDHFQRILRAVESRPGRILLGASLAGLPDVGARFPGAVALEPEAPAFATERHVELIRRGDEGIHFITRLPGSGTAASAARPGPASAPAPGSRESGRCRIDIDDGALTLHPGSGPTPRLNGAAVNGPAAIAHNDLIEFAGGRSWRLLEVSAEERGSDG